MAGKKPDKVIDAIAATLDAAKADAVPIEGGPVSVDRNMRRSTVAIVAKMIRRGEGGRCGGAGFAVS